MTEISIVVPLLNEAPNLRLLYQKITESLARAGCSYEIVFVDDGSTDSSLEILRRLHAMDPSHVRVVELQRNFGKTAALVAGFEIAQGNVFVTLDADLQDDPGEIPDMVAELDRGYDLVVGWRKTRQDRRKKRLSSRVFNVTVANLLGVPLHDFNSGFKVYRRLVIESIRLYSDLHRYIPVLAAWRGFRVTEREVVHHPRNAGDSKYTTRRAARGFMDLLMVLFITRYLRHPLRLFGWLGIVVFAVGSLIESYLATLWLLRLAGLISVAPIGTRPLFSVGILAMILGVQLFSIGLLGEMLRYFTYRPEEEFMIRQVLR